MFHLLLPIGVACLLATAARAAIIDSFDDGPFELLHAENYTPGVRLLQTGLSSASVVGGSREVHLRSLGSATGEITAAGEFIFNSVVSGGYFTLRYGAESPLNLNLLNDGNDAFLLTFSDLDLTSGLAWINLKTAGGGAQAEFTTELRALKGAGSIHIPFSRFRLYPASENLSDVDEITIYFGRMPAPGRMVISSIETVPEPGAALFVTGGVAMLSLRRRTRSVRPLVTC